LHHGFDRFGHFSFPPLSDFHSSTKVLLTLEIRFDIKNSGSSLDLAGYDFHPSRVIVVLLFLEYSLRWGTSADELARCIRFRVPGLSESILITRNNRAAGRRGWHPLRRPECHTLYVARGRHGALDTDARNFLGRHDGREGQDWFKSKPSKWSSCSRRCRRATRSRAPQRRRQSIYN
jgi:hypothetical protein